MHFFVEFIRAHIPATWKQNSTGWVSGNCPVCTMNGEARPDKKGRGGFHFSEDEFVYHCFNCRFKTGWQAGSAMGAKVKILMKQFGVETAELQRASIELMREEETTKLLNPVQEEQPAFVPNWPERELPEGTTNIHDVDSATTNFNNGVLMLNDRKLLHWRDWTYTGTGIKYRKRIILPYRYKGNIVGYNARYIGDPPSGTPKYMVQKPPHHVFNLDEQISGRDTVVVVEGDFDAINISAVALGSNSLSNEQASLINQLKKKVVLLPDADAAGAALIEPAIREGWAVSFPEWMDEFKDANAAVIKYGRAFVLHSVLTAATDNPTKIRVLAKRYLK